MPEGVLQIPRPTEVNKLIEEAVTELNATQSGPH